MKEGLVETIIEGIRDKKGQNITVLDLREAQGAIADYYIICEATNTTQVDAIADSVEDRVRKDLKEKPMHMEGKANATWVLIDYYDVIVHVFYKPTREFYNIEGLWNDVPRQDYEE